MKSNNIINIYIMIKTLNSDFVSELSNDITHMNCDKKIMGRH